MAISATTVWEVRTDGSDNNGGGFTAGASGVDRSQQAAAHAVLTVASAVHTTTTQINVDAGDHTVHADDVGNLLQVTAGAATAGFYRITAADTANNRWTVDRAVGTSGQTVAGSMGGALATPKMAQEYMVNSNLIWVRGGTYDQPSNVTEAVTGVTTSRTAPVHRMIGYGTVRGDGGRPTIQASSSCTRIIDLTAQGWLVKNFILDCNGVADYGLYTTANFSQCINIKTLSHNVLGMYFNGSSSEGRDLEASDGQPASTGGIEVANFTQLHRVWTHDNVGFGFRQSFNGNCTHTDLLSTNNTSHGVFFDGGRGLNLRQFTCFGNGGDGINWTGRFLLTTSFVYGVLAENDGYGINFTDGSFAPTIIEADYLAFYGNSSGARNNAPEGANDITLSADPFVNSASDDYSLNDVSGGGAVLRAASTGPPQQSASRDIGAVQTGGSGGGTGRPRIGTGGLIF